ncbi:DNA/RNA non-specific endonuclease [Olsenella sp. An293]|uniref:DNA/RNA non-specific endonuclease n=1 Tax=Olsenella sp. An293 TaxID=1965626 RepID=UPI000B39555F|nr:DNA/RNA non-specific endonuclease [Olsenella sp. An293]OUO33966.1 hypothetical protein B5F85_01150 [Olsenella sp. An293]
MAAKTRRRGGIKVLLAIFLIAAALGCIPSRSKDETPAEPTPIEQEASREADEEQPVTLSAAEDADSESESEPVPAPEPAPEPEPAAAVEPEPEPAQDPVPAAAPERSPFDLSQVPEYSGSPVVAVNGNAPELTAADADGLTEYYSPLDSLGRCGVVMALVGPETMPTEERGSIGMVKPSGWHTVRYDDLVDGKYLYNRCHLIAYQLTGENANTRNLVTGTRYMNMEGMLSYENDVADYVERTGSHVIFRAEPVFEGDELVCRGVHLEALSYEDGGAGLSYNVFCYNVQPGVGIDYATGDSWRTAPEPAPEPEPEPAEDPAASDEVTYILNVNTNKFHLPGCSSVKQMSEKNKREFTGTREEAIARGFDPCKRCNP